MGLFSFAKGLRKSKEEFRVTIQPNVLQDLKQRLAASGKSAVRFEVEDVGWGGPELEIVLDEQEDTDIMYETSGVIFVIEKSLGSAVSNPEIIKVGEEIKVKSTGCCH